MSAVLMRVLVAAYTFL